MSNKASAAKYRQTDGAKLARKIRRQNPEVRAHDAARRKAKKHLKSGGY